MRKKSYPKAPKAPKANASPATIDRYNDRVKEWEKKCAEIDKHNSGIANSRKKLDGIKARVSKRRAKKV